MKVHFLGIGGSGASAAAAIAQAQGFEITGCDLEPHNEFTTHFKKSQLSKGHDSKHLDCNLEGYSVDILAVTPAIFSLDPDNPELVEAKKKNIPVLTWQQFVGEYLTKDKFVIAVAGTHGKTTTTAMIGQLLEDANLDPTVLLGAINPKWGTNYRLSEQTTSDRNYFVIEADEFNDNFLAITPDISVVTNIEMDHPEYFKNLEAVKSSFQKFLLQTKGTIIANLSDPVVKQTSNVQTRSVHSIIDYSKYLIDFSLQIPGEFNKWNASAAYQVGLILRLNPQIIQKSLSNYTGVGRRFEYIGKFKGAEIYSDFGHHPTEIKVTMEAARQKFPNQRIILIYQPHMFSRTKALFNDFVQVFKNLPLDKTFVMDIYPSREMDTGLITSKQLVKAINKESVIYIGNTNQTLDKLKPEIKDGDIVFFMSAGDTDYLAKKLTSSLN
ncbi:UDP-N-acetylmuramate--L-alanine ligase [Candidatus Microgenomates bacterium]|nr:UDP-N-acetylmuramate--L-alanine ligase [Candidatus Microgenomates bacterium]